MNRFPFIGFVIVSLFLVEFETKEFCEAFKENNYTIDYTFEFRNDFNNRELMYPLIIIGTNYWEIEDSDNDYNFTLVSTNGYKSEIFCDHYITAFSIPRKTKDWEYAFLEKGNRLRIVYIREKTKRPKDLALISKSEFEIEFRNPSFGEHSFVPKFSFFWTELIIEHQGIVSRSSIFQAFVDQTENNDTNGVKRDYITIGFEGKYDSLGNNGWDDWKIAETSYGQDYIIGVFGHLLYNSGNRSLYLVLYSNNKTIEYCLMDATKPKLNFSVDQTCIPQRMSLIDCKSEKILDFTEIPEKKEKDFWFTFGLILIMMCIPLALLLCATFCCNIGGCRDWLFGKCINRKRRPPKRQSVSESTYSSSIAQSFSTGKVEYNSSNISGTSEALSSKSTISDKKIKSSKNDAKKTSTKKQSPKK